MTKAKLTSGSSLGRKGRASVHRKGQLREDGSLGHVGGYQFVDAVTVIGRLQEDGCGVLLEVRTGERAEFPMGNGDAIAWLNANCRDYVFEAWYDGVSEPMRVAAWGTR